ncbi:hypothetical protein SCLCIDRAFT_336069 [Scleroderma citrinum Foug A]|uniref:Uncharacterized protein n=1 Tax=Scleroderma citrinum Foug A TaxID=1036808 RepID=A0A0C3DF02_9AGAM|nr:hypothetical protein SCLCIDRAFT_336069 [Scleroderma citrinum Foug A]
MRVCHHEGRTILSDSCYRGWTDCAQHHCSHVTLLEDCPSVQLTKYEFPRYVVLLSCEFGVRKPCLRRTSFLDRYSLRDNRIGYVLDNQTVVLGST